MIMLTVFYISSYVSASKNDSRTVQLKDKLSSNGDSTKSDELSNGSLMQEVSHPITQKSCQAKYNEIDLKEENNKPLTNKNSTCEDQHACNPLYDDHKIDHSITAKNNAELNSLSVTPNERNNYSFRAWDVFYDNTITYSNFNVYAFKKLKFFYLSGLVDGKVEMKTHNLTFVDKMSILLEKMVRNNKFYSDSELIEKYKEAYYKQRKRFDDAVAFEQRIYPNYDFYTQELQHYSFFDLKFTASYVWNLGFIQESSHSILEKMSIIIILMQEICESTDDDTIKEILAEVFRSHLDFFIQTRHIKKLYDTIAKYKDVPAEQYKNSDRFQKEYSDNRHSKRKFDKKDQYKEDGIIFTSYEMNEFLDLFVLFCKEKQRLLKNYNIKCYDMETFEMITEKIEISIIKINGIIKNMFVLGVMDEKYWMMSKRLRIEMEISNLFSTAEEKHIGTLKDLNASNKHNKDDTSITEEEASIALFNGVCNLIQKKYSESLVKKNGAFKLYPITDYAISKIELERFYQHIVNHKDVPIIVFII